MRIFFTALGCRLNQAEIETLGRDAARRGHEVVGAPAEADWAVINTCTVTHVADRKSRQAIRRLHRDHPELRIAVIGCYGEISRQEAESLPGVALVLSNLDKGTLLDRLGAEPQPTGGDERAALTHLPCERTRAFIKVQDGCENACSYCLVTLARGPARSVPPERVLAVARERRAEGVNEIVLSGVNIGSYGRDEGPTAAVSAQRGWTLARLSEAILAEVDVPRLRFSSIEPWDVTPDLLTLFTQPRVCRQLHLPLQSGCDATLQRMNRRMLTAGYAALVERARALIPGVSITADVMVGFPGESEDEFATSLRFVERMGFARLHVFRYSPRPGTPAYALPNRVPPDVAQQRGQEMTALGRRLALDSHRHHVGQEVMVLFESAQEEHGRMVWSGWTDDYVRVQVTSAADLGNRLLSVHITRADAQGLVGELL